MDFKVAGTEKGITAIQMDIKIAGFSRCFKNALRQAKAARIQYIDKMKNVYIAKKRVSKYAPKIITMTIDPDKIRDVIGPGGKVINKIIAETGVKIDIKEDGNSIYSVVIWNDSKLAQKNILKDSREVEVG